MSKSYYRILLGEKNKHAHKCFAEGFIGGSWGINEDLSQLVQQEDSAGLGEKLSAIYLETHPTKTKIGAGHASGMLRAITSDLQLGDLVMSRDESGDYKLGMVDGPYVYVEGPVLPHRRPVKWFEQTVKKSDLSEDLRKSVSPPLTVVEVSKHAAEIERLLQGGPLHAISEEGELIESQSAFALEKHLEEFIVHNWTNTDFGKNYDIYSEDGSYIGQQYPTDSPHKKIDILAISKDQSELLVIELKRGRPSDSVIGQLMRYMGFIKSKCAADGQRVRGCIVAFEPESGVKHAMRVSPDIDYYTYSVNFQLNRVSVD